ncbi:MFS transporter [Altererythrobacter xixiisoli]|uniref:MFS transporter n=1 Tax=Croceibacterium xixiisoli TaxID=1476466 RepID=A0A6I4U000_9SPHN|nr:MFS transporter [Croceibacterium xixiisoli]MXP00670.1 MFS transporter [Croceibacterium xixiisoli]
MTRPSSRLLLPALILLVGVNLRPALAAISPLLDQIQHDTALGDTGASLLTTLPVMLMGICLLGTVQLKSLFGNRGGVALGLAAIAIACLARWQWPAIASLLVTAVIGGVGIAIVQALMPAIIRQRAGMRAAGMMGLYSTAIMGGAAIASFAAPRISPDHGWPAAVGIWGVPALIALAVWWLAVPKSAEPGSPAPSQAVWRQGRAWLLVLLFGLGTGAYTLVLAWLPPFYTQLGWSAPAAGGLLAGVTLAEVASGTAVSLCVDRFADRRPLLLSAIAALLAGLAGLITAPLMLAWPAALLIGLGIGALFPLSLIVAMDHGDSPAQAGAIVGFVQGGGYMIASLLPLAAGILRQNLSDLRPAWWLMAGLSLVLALIAARLRPGRHLA